MGARGNEDVRTKESRGSISTSEQYFRVGGRHAKDRLT